MLIGVYPLSASSIHSSRCRTYRPVHIAFSVEVDVLEFVVIGSAILHIVINVLIGCAVRG